MADTRSTNDPAPTAAGSSAGPIGSPRHRAGAVRWAMGWPYATASVIGVAIVFAMTAMDKGHNGITAFAVETSTPGWQVTRVEDKMGIHGAHSAQLSFTDMRVPRDNLLVADWLRHQGLDVRLAAVGDHRCPGG